MKKTHFKKIASLLLGVSLFAETMLPIAVPVYAENYFPGEEQTALSSQEELVSEGMPDEISDESVSDSLYPDDLSTSEETVYETDLKENEKEDTDISTVEDISDVENIMTDGDDDDNIKNENENEIIEEKNEKEEEDTDEMELDELPGDAVLDESTENKSSDSELNSTLEYTLQDGNGIAFCPRGYTPETSEEEIVGASSVATTVKGKIRYDIAYYFLDLMNAYRNRNGLSSVSMDKSLLDLAIFRASNITVYYEHALPDGSHWGNGLIDSGAEILTSDFISNSTSSKDAASKLLQMFIDSYYHNEILLYNSDDPLDVCGIGVVEVNGLYYIVVDYYFDPISYTPARRSDTPSSSWSFNTTHTMVGVKEKYIKGNNAVTLTPVGYQYDAGDFFYSYERLYTHFPQISRSSMRFSSSDASIATVSSSGVLYPKKNGTFYLSVTYGGRTIKQEMIVSDIYVLSDDTVTVTYNSPVTYTGKAQTFNLKVLNDETVSYLVKNKNYKVSYSNNVNVGTSKITITGINGCQGTLTKTAKITPANIGKAASSGLNKYYEYTGKNITPAITLKYNGITLKKGKDYTVAYSNNKECGTAAITVTGINNFKGSSKKFAFKIVPHVILSSHVSGVSSSVKYTGKNITMPVKVVYKGKTLTAGKEYKITYKNNKYPGKATVTVTGMGDYYGVVAKHFNIIRNISSAKVKTKYASYKYTGYALKPSPIVTLGSVTLKQGEDYTVKYQHNRFGTATITVTGKGYYKGTAKGTFKIYIPNVPIYRLYNSKSGEHFFTRSSSERNSLIKSGWKNEGIAWYAPQVSSQPIYRLSASGKHHYTKSVAERNRLVSLGWKAEGIAWYSNTASKKVPVYRYYNPNSGHHHYTKNKGEGNYIVKHGWKYEGIAFYVSK